MPRAACDANAGGASSVERPSSMRHFPPTPLHHFHAAALRRRRDRARARAPALAARARPRDRLGRSYDEPRGARLRQALERLGPDLHQVRPGAVHAARPAAGRHRRRARAAAGPRAAVRRPGRARAGRGRPAQELGASSRTCSRPSTPRRSPAPPSPRCTSPRVKGGREVAVKVLRPNVLQAIESDLAHPAHRGALGRAHQRRRQAPAPARRRGRVRRLPARRAGPDPRGRQRRAAAPQHGQPRPDPGARDAVGLLHLARDGDGAHVRRADQPGRAPARWPASTSPSWRATASRSSSRRCFATASSTPTCTPATSW